jgi:hypothetical protein
MVKTILGGVLENSSIKVPVAYGGYVIDPVNGNPIPNTRLYTVLALLDFVEKPPKQFASSQPNDSPMIWVDGNVTEVIDQLMPDVILPAAMPDGMARNGFKATIGNVTGIFYPVIKIKETELDPYLDLSILGEEIWGWFDAKAKLTL